MSVLLRGGLVVNADAAVLADVLIQGETIAAVGPNLVAPEGTKVIDVTGKQIFPGMPCSIWLAMVAGWCVMAGCFGSSQGRVG